MIQDPIAVTAILLAIVATLFRVAKTALGKRIFGFVPLIVFCYFVPTLLSNLGFLPMESAAYTFIKKTLLPASLFLLTLSVDIPTIKKLGPKVLYLFFGATASVFIGSALTYASLGWLLPAEAHLETWKGLAALCASWIGGGANFVAVGQSVGASDQTLGLMVIVDVAVASVWMAVLLYFAGKEKALDEKIGADRSMIDEVRKRIESYQLSVLQTPNLVDWLSLAALSMSAVAVSTGLAKILPDIGTIINGFTWIVMIVTALGVVASYTPLRKLEGAGASVLGSVFLYMLIATIGAQGDFKSIVRAPVLVLMGAVWMSFHAGFMLWLRKKLKAPIFFMAVGSQANIGAAASAPIVASAFHPSLVTVGVLLAILGYVMGTYLAILNAFLLEQIYLALYAF